MLIEIYGAGFINKGAQLMLWTVVQRLKQADPSVEVCVQREPLWAPDSREAREAYGLQTVIPSVPRRGNREKAYCALEGVQARLSPRSFLRSRGFVRRTDCDALIDISGYAFGDKWTGDPFRRFIKRSGEYHRCGKPVVMLPQMFGPFERPGYADMFRQMLRQVDLVYARDRVSLDYVHRAAPDAGHVRLAPDITIFSDLMSGELQAVDDPEYVCVVPNARMIDKGGEAWAGSYARVLAEAVRHILGAGFEVHFLPHEVAGGDQAIVHELLAEVNDERCRVVVEHDPLQIKRHIAGSRFIVSSRFHSIVGALSSGVPAITMGWAHKYDVLLEDFGVSDLLCGAEDAAERVPELIRALSDQGTLGRYRRVLTESKAAMREAHEQMWQDTYGVLGIEALSQKPSIEARRCAV